MDTNTKAFIGESATTFATEIGIVIRNDCPMNFHKWDLIPEAMKTILYEKLEGKFQLLRTNKAFMKYVDGRLHAQWVRTRGALSRHWKENGGKTYPQRARLQVHSNCWSQDDWDHVCDYWELEKPRVSMLIIFYK
ncbi:hypothetical protein L1987_87512 [Smallanthus sonchifolius]|nr:hypothetical protein L1987_87512 [Smallanthus sonchifolius]